VRILLGVVAGALVFASLAAGGVGSSKPKPKPSLAFVSFQPLTVHGRHFVPRERVRVTFTMGKAAGHVRFVRASAAGTFSTSPPVRISYDPCSSTLVVNAVGGRGDTALLKRPQRACAPASTP
jgi:hypothetical protein